MMGEDRNRSAEGDMNREDREWKKRIESEFVAQDQEKRLNALEKNYSELREDVLEGFKVLGKEITALKLDNNSMSERINAVHNRLGWIEKGVGAVIFLLAIFFFWFVQTGGV